MTIGLNHFEGGKNITPGSRRGTDKILPELINEAAGLPVDTDTDTQRGVFQSAETLATGVEQDIAHGLGAVPTAVLVSVTDDNGAAFTITEGAHDATNVKVTVTAGAKFKVIAIY